MSDLGTNDAVAILNKRLVSNLVVSIDEKFQRQVALAIFQMEAAAAFSPMVNTWLNRGIEDPREITANAVMPIPRTLYATSNPAFLPVPPGATDRDTLLNRINRYDAIASGSVVDTIPAGTDPINNPCPITFKEDPNSRFTFLRDLYSRSSLPSLTVTSNGLQATIRGTAFRGGLFSRHLAFAHPTHDFEMALLYRFKFIQNSDVNMGPVPFVMVAPPPAGSPQLPSVGRVVFATFDPATKKYVLPISSAQKPFALNAINNPVYQFTVDDLIYEPHALPPPVGSGSGIPTYRVEPKSAAEPQKYVIRKIGSPTILAEARAGRLVLGFERMVSLNMTPRSGQNPVTAGEKTAIGNSLIKIQPTLAQAFTCAIGTPSAPTNLNLLNLLGPTSLDIPLMPHHVLYAASPAIVTAADIMLGDPGPLGSIKSLMVDCDLSAAAYFTGSQSIAVCGKIGGVGDPLFTDFSSGADVSVGLSQNFAQPMLRELGSQIISDILDDDAKNKSIPGLDRNSLTANVTFQSNAVHVHVNGAGSVKGAFLFFDADFSFDLHTDIRMRAQKAVVQDLRDDPVHVGQLMSVAKDRFDCDIPAPVLKSFGLDISENKLDLPAPSAHQNPLSFLAYYDPGNGSAPHDGELAQRVPPPVYDAAGTEIVRPDQTNPPTGCGPDQPDRYGQKSFADPKLKPQWEVWALPPRKDDTRVDVHPSFWSYLLFIAAGILGSVAALLVPFIGFALSPMIAIATIVLLPFVHLIAGAIATPMVQDRVGKQNRPPIDLDTNVGSVLGLYIEDPTGPRQPVTIQDGALITRFHAVVQAAAFNEGFGGG